jgi:hypothetical protein
MLRGLRRDGMALSRDKNGTRGSGLLTALGCMLLFIAFSARADLEVNARVDKVVLTDGTVIECVVLMVAENGALIVEGDPKDKASRRQRLIPKNEISKIVRGEANGTISGYQTDTELCHKVIQGTGFRKEEPKKVIDKDNVKAPTTAYDPETLAKLKLNKDLAEPVPSSKLTPQELRDAYLSRFPALKETAQALLGNDRALQVLDQAVKGDPLVRRQVEGFLNLVVSQNAAPAAIEAVMPNKVTRPIKPKKPRRDEADVSAPAGK